MTQAIDRYDYHVAWSDDDEAFIAHVTEFRSLSAHGDTMEAALGEIRNVVEAVIDELEENGEPIPEPLSSRSYSGKLNVRMPESLHRKLAHEAEVEGVSLNQLINMKLAR
jgi:predicted HicB family RNase H-like nuclease